MRASRFSAALLALLFAFAAAAEDLRLGGVPLPKDATASAAASPWAGTWFGRWSGEMRTIVVVERIEGADIDVLYAVGPNRAGTYQGGWRRMSGQVADGAVRLNGPNYTLDLSLAPSGRMRGVYNETQGFAIFTRRDEAAVGAAIWSPGESVMLSTDIVENGAPIALETVILRPDGDGPFPLAVVSHGSTGSGRDPKDFSLTFMNDWLAEWLVERGYLVAFPQRRGRGSSEGLYDEGFAEDRAEGYTCKAERSLAGADRALEDLGAAIRALKARDDVADDSVLLAGLSRGGILSVAYAGARPEEVAGVVNFVGGWLGDLCDSASTVNGTLAARGGGFPGPMLWLYGDDDPYYSLDHSRGVFAAFEASGGTGAFMDFKVAGAGNGHWVMSVPPLWERPMADYLDEIR